MKTPDRVAFHIFGFDVMWYGILVAVGIALVVAVSCMRAKKHGLTSDRTLNYAIVAIISGIIGARLYYIIFNWSYYAEDLGRIFDLRGGGLAIHGGLILGSLSVLIMCRFFKDKPLNMLDLFFSAVPLGQAIGRWGNYFNGEAHGVQTDLPWGVVVDGVSYHPTFLYESIWCVLLFVFLQIIDNHRQFVGQTFLLYAILYSVERFFVEWLRTDSLIVFGFLKQAMLLSGIVIVVSIFAYVYLSKKKKKRKRN